VAAYVIAEVAVTDPEGYEAYKSAVEKTLVQYGGRYKVRGGQAEALEGDAPRGRLVVLEFDSYEQAKTWYDSPENGVAKKIRHATATSRLLLVDGY
jgi:uncharacterized protein (DUF1330 family)